MQNSSEIHNVALNHLREKYKEDFEVVWCVPRNIDAFFDEVMCVNEQGQYVKVFIEEDVNDNYFGVLKEKEYKELLAPILKKYISSYKIFSRFTASYFRSDFDKDTALMDALNSEGFSFFSRCVIFVNESIEKELDKKAYEEVKKELEKTGLKLYFVMYSVPSEVYETIDENKDVNEYLPTGGVRHQLLEMMIN